MTGYDKTATEIRDPQGSMMDIQPRDSILITPSEVATPYDIPQKIGNKYTGGPDSSSAT